MPQTKTPDSKFNLAPNRERRVASQVPNSPVADDSDPTREIRRVIDELQETGQSTRERLRIVEHERDTLAAQVVATGKQLLELKSHEQQFKQQLADATALQRERDEARDARDRLARETKEIERKLQSATRQRDAATRQRDEATLRSEEVTRSARESAALLAEVQKQIISIRQARDAAQAQTREHSIKLAHLDDEIAELGHARDAAQKAARQAGEKVAEFHRQLDAVTQDRDATAKQVGSLQRELDEQRAKVLNLTEQKSAVATADSEHLAALAEAREQVASLTIERDAAQTRAQEHARALEDIREQARELRDRLATESVPAAELEEARRQIAALAADRDRHLAREKDFLEETGSQQERLASLTGQLATTQLGREEALASLTTAQQQIDHVTRERDAVHQQNTESALNIENQLSALRKQVSELEQRASEAGQRIDAAKRERDNALERASHFEDQRLQSIDLAAKLDAAKRDLLNLSADLAEARLQLKFAQAGKNGAKSAPKPPTLPASPRLGDIQRASFAALEDDPELDDDATASPEHAPINEPLTDKHAKGAVAAMKKCLQSFTSDPADLSLLNEMHCHAHCFAERARVSGYIALHRLGTSFASLVHELYGMPEQVNPSTLRTVSQTIDFIGVLIKQKDYGKLPDPSKARVYAVDDEPDNADAIRMAMESVMLRTQSTQEPAIALAELESGRFDLVFLDINMPNVDGFELCQMIRNLPSCARTPIVFLTGMTTAENRVQSSLCGGNDFVGKPFNLHELSVKALTLILKTSLGLE